MKVFIAVFLVLASFYSEKSYGFAKPRPLPPPPPPAAPVTEHGDLKIKILSYNVHGLHLPWHDTTPLSDIGKILRERRKNGTAPQIVAIQEGFHADVIHLINEAGYPYSKSGPGPTFSRAGSGLIFLSEFPILDSRGMVFDHANSEGFDWDVNKGVHFVKIRLPGMSVPLELLNTHMQADYDTAFDPLYLTQAARRRQIVELGNFFWQVNDRNSPLVFVGDFNSNTVIGDYQDILSRTFLSGTADRCLSLGSCRNNVDLQKEMRESPDHQFYRPNSTVTLEPLSYEKTFREQYNGRVLSDHDGLEVQYQVRW